MVDKCYFCIYLRKYKFFKYFGAAWMTQHSLNGARFPVLNIYYIFSFNSKHENVDLEQYLPFSSTLKYPIILAILGMFIIIFFQQYPRTYCQEKIQPTQVCVRNISDEHYPCYLSSIDDIFQG